MSPRQYLADFIPRASCWFSHDCPSIPKEVIPWVLAAEDAHSYFYTNIHEKYAPYETKSNDPVFLRRPQLHEIQQDIEDYSKVVIARVKTFTDSKYLIESILSELPDPLEFKRYIDNLIDDAEDSDGSSIYTISEVSDSSYVSSYEPSEDDEKLLEDFI